MYTVYLVEDEPLVLSDMRESIPWAEHDLTVVGTSTDPAKALDEILTLKPEVVFTDIHMQDTSGLELIDRLKKQGAECEFVVVSAHERFEYARQVIQLGGFDYLIKPVVEEQYTDLLTRLLQRLDHKHPHKNLPSTSSNELNQIILYLNRSLVRKHSLKEISAKFSISSNYICSLFSKHLQTTFSAYTTKIRMENADRLLLSTQKSVKEIALDCGYDDYFYFCRVFRDYYGCTPTQRRSGTGAGDEK